MFKSLHIVTKINKQILPLSAEPMPLTLVLLLPFFNTDNFIACIISMEIGRINKWNVCM